MNVKRFFKATPPEVNFLAGISFALLVLKVFWLNRYPAPFHVMYEAGVIFQEILVSVLASYIFYLIVVRLKEHSDLENIRPYIGVHAKRIAARAMQQLSDVSAASGVTLDIATLSASDVRLAFSKIAPYSQAPLIIAQPLVYANWVQYFSFHKEDTKERVRKLLEQSRFLDAKLLAMIVKIDDCSHFSIIGSLANFNANNESIDFLASTFYEYCTFCNTLDDFLVRHEFDIVKNK